MRLHLNVLLLTSDQTEALALQEILNEHVVLSHVPDLGELERLLECDHYDTLFCAWHFQTGTWSDALAEVRRHDPNLPIIVLSRVGTEQEWLEVLNVGAFDLLAPPYREQGLLSVLEQAAASREAQGPEDRCAPSQNRKSVPLERGIAGAWIVVSAFPGLGLTTSRCGLRGSYNRGIGKAFWRNMEIEKEATPDRSEHFAGL